MIDDALAAALTLIELRETRLLSRGIHDGFLTRDEILETLKDELNAEETNTRLVLRTLYGFPRPLPLG